MEALIVFYGHSTASIMPAIALASNCNGEVSLCLKPFAARCGQRIVRETQELLKI
jgi:hypothetical protein